jgi:hypothetical protein
LFGSKASNQKKLEQLRQRAAALTTKRDEAKSELEAATAARQSFLLDGDLADAKAAAKLQARVDTGQSTLAGFDAALGALTPQIAEVEQLLADEQQRAERKIASEKIDQEVAVIRNKIAPWLTATRELAALWEKQAVLRFEAGAIGRYLANAAGEAEVAANVTLVDLQGAARAIADGREAIPRPPPVLIAAPASTPPPEVSAYFSLQPGKFVDVQGRLQRVPRYVFCELTDQQAAIALRIGGVCKLDDPRVQQLRHQMATQQLPEPWHCWDFDTGAEPVRDPQLMARHSSTGSGRTVFEPLPNVRAPYQITVPVTPAVAARSEDTDHD